MRDFKGKIEKVLGLPDFATIEKIVELTRDRTGLRDLKGVVQAATELARVAPQLDKVLDMVKLLRAAHQDGSLKEIAGVLRSLNSLVGKVPLELGEVILALKEELSQRSE